ncbi:LysR family transcriptional regulator [Xylophilus sp. ASV27]|uniref:LysR family transcriptional regulator n=1 Tax=Xylophilus sp. ASV27 TaxID=2795129 RepID=UPI0018EAA028|nr:LysR family transcriptional regulator [Xylophilus sp. ASV27]
MTFNRLHFIRQVDLFTLRLFLSAVDEQQIGRAAIRENIAASTATKRIQDFEEIAGVPLLERTPKGVVATPAGEVIVRYIRKLFSDMDDMRAEIAAFGEGLRGEVFVASARSIFVPFLSRELGNFARDFPQVDLVLRELENTAIVQAVIQGDADIGVFAMAPGLDLGGINTHPYRTDRLVAVVPEAHPLAAHASVSFEELVPENLIVISAMHATFAKAARKLGGEYKPKYSVRSTGVAMSLAQARLGVTVQPECDVVQAQIDGVVAVPMSDAWARRIVQIATPRERTLSPAARALLEQLLSRPADTPPGA